MKRIFVLYTGGTFGSIQTPKGVAPASLDVIKPMLPPTDATTAVTIQSYGRILDSSSIVPQDWVSIGRIIFEQYDHFDGFVILHGTDSMAFTSGALSHLFQGLNKPIVLTGSQVPLSFNENDAKDNFLHAVRFASGNKSGVWIVFGGKEIPGDRAVKVSCERWQAFDDPKSISSLPEPDKRPLAFQEAIETDVRLIYCHPGLSIEKLIDEILTPAKGIVIASYGIGNLPLDDRIDTALTKAIKQQGKRIIQVTQCAHGRINAGFYRTGGAMASTGVETGHNLTIEAALTKLMVELAV